MRATRSDDTLLDGAFVPDRYIARVVPAGFAGADCSCSGSSPGPSRRSPASTSRSPERARDLAVAGVEQAHVDRARRTDAGAPPDASARGRRDGARARRRSTPHVEQTSPTTGRTASTTAACGRRSSSSAKYHAVEAAKRVVDLAMEVSGGTRDVPIERAGAAVPRRALRRLSPGEQRRSRTRSSARPRSACSPTRSAGSRIHPFFRLNW